MLKKIALCLAFAAGSTLLVAAAVGCDSNGNTGGGGGSGGSGGSGGGGGGGGGGNPDMGFQCVMNPMTDPDFLNSCAPASVQSVDITPFYPALAPNGQLPSLP
jgi:hypothetical protein